VRERQPPRSSQAVSEGLLLHRRRVPMSTKIKQVVAEFGKDFDNTFGRIVCRFMDTCEETEIAANEFTSMADGPKRVAEIGEELAALLGAARYDVASLLIDLRQAIRATHAGDLTD
jgi:hypothetical protein